MGTYTDNSKFYIPTPHESNYETALDPNWEQLDTLPVNARAYLKGDGTTEDAGAITDFVAAANAVGHCYLPGGVFLVPDATPLFAALAADVVIQGAGRNKTIISTKNAYVFQTPATGNIDRVVIQDLSTVLRAGATSGGGIKAVSDSYHSGWDINRVDCGGVSTSTDALVYVDGFIGSHISGTRAYTGGGDGIKVTNTGFASNAYSIQRCSVQACALGGTTYAGIRAMGGHGRILNSIVEQTRGYGVYLYGAVMPVVSEVWFEDNWNTNLVGEDVYVAAIEKNKFHYHNPSAVAAARHVYLTASSAAQHHMNSIERNHFTDSPASGKAIEIGTNVEQTYIANNRGTGLSGSTGGGSILDNGTSTKYGGNDTDAGFHAGTGSPEGVVTARMGSIYLQLGGGVSTSLYVKTSGTGNTGWTAK